MSSQGGDEAPGCRAGSFGIHPGIPGLRKRFSIRVLLLSFGVFLLDQVTKAIALWALSSTPSLPILPGLFHLTLVRNTGVAFGLFRGVALPVALVTTGILAALYWSSSRKGMPVAAARGSPTGTPFGRRTTALRPVSLGLILGGAAGNLLDRVRFGAVIDFLDFRIWPVFNVADSCITIGAALMAWRLIRKR